MPRSPRSPVLASLLLLVACGGDGSPSGDDDPPDPPDPFEEEPEREVSVCAQGSADYPTIAAAIADAPSGTAIRVCAGVYAEHLAIDGDRTLWLIGDGAATTTIDGSEAGTVVSVSNGAVVTIEGFAIQRGRSTHGGGVRCEGAAVALRAVTLATNRGDTMGGGLYGISCVVEIEQSSVRDNQGEDGGGLASIAGWITVRDSELRGNVAGVKGGALYADADAVIEGNTFTANQSGWTGGAMHLIAHAPTIRGNTIDGNTAVDDGGGIYLHQSAAIIEDNLITANAATDDGGGLRIFESAAYVARNTIAGNHAGGDGGGIKCSHVASQFLDNEVVDNDAAGVGGGLELDNDASVLRGGVVARNHASIGGGIHLMLWPWNGGVIEDVEITQNRAWRGGGVALDDNFIRPTLRRLSITGNIADHGGGVWSTAGNADFTNSLIAGNTAYDDGGGLHLAASEPWVEECTCPPVNPPSRFAFLVIHGNTSPRGAAIFSDAPAQTIESSILSGHTGTAVVVTPQGRPTWRFNNTYPATFDGMWAPTGGDGNLATEPMFMAPPTDFRLQGVSACVDAGDPTLTDPDGSRADMGRFGGPEAL